MFKKIQQAFCIHKWTCKADEGIPPRVSVNTTLVDFLEYATMYCKKCGAVSTLSLNHIKLAKEKAKNDKR